MAGRDMIVIGASAGGVEALVELVRGLPDDLPAAVFIVLHLPIDARSYLPSILARAGPLPAAHAVDQATIRLGQIVVAPPNHHLVLEDGRTRLTFGPRINGVRPSIDALFRSAARTYGPRVVGVILSGTLSDGVLGLDMIKLRGGTAIVQDPDEARFPDTPRRALERIAVDAVAPAVKIPLLLSELTARPADAATSVGAEVMTRERQDESSIGALASAGKMADQASGLSCPNCNGSVWELSDGTLTRIECRVGHAFSVEAFLGEQAIALEAALWSAINALQERAAALRRFAARIGATSQTAADYQQRAEEIERQARLLREGLIRVMQAETASIS